MVIKDNENILVERLEIEIEKTGHITNCYVLKDKATSKGCVIDPAFDEKYIITKLQELSVQLEAIIVTHSHADHIAALAKLVEYANVNVYVHEKDYEGLYNKLLNEEEVVQTVILPVKEDKVVKVKDTDIITIGNTKLEIVHTPGHTRGSMVLFDNLNNILFAGDTIFERTYGRTDLIAGSHDDMGNTLNKLFDRFDNMQVFPGHGKVFNLKDSKRGIRLLYSYKG